MYTATNGAVCKSIYYLLQVRIPPTPSSAALLTESLGLEVHWSHSSW